MVLVGLINQAFVPRVMVNGRVCVFTRAGEGGSVWVILFPSLVPLMKVLSSCRLEVYLWLCFQC